MKKLSILFLVIAIGSVANIQAMDPRLLPEVGAMNRNNLEQAMEEMNLDNPEPSILQRMREASRELSKAYNHVANERIAGRSGFAALQNAKNVGNTVVDFLSRNQMHGVGGLSQAKQTLRRIDHDIKLLESQMIDSDEDSSMDVDSDSD